MSKSRKYVKVSKKKYPKGPFSHSRYMRRVRKLRRIGKKIR